MDWTQMTVYTTSQGCEYISSMLFSIGVTGIEIFDPEDYKHIEKNYTWDYIDDEVLALAQKEAYIRIYFPHTPYGIEQIELVKSHISALKGILGEFDLGTLRIELEERNDLEWTESWKKYFKPLNVGEKFIVCPEWIKINEGENPENRNVLIMNPGMIFGSGTHETTRLCMEEIEMNIKAGMSVTDVGCGTGILAITALMCGAASAKCIDIDPNANEIVPENMSLNGMSEDKYEVIVGDILEKDVCDKIDGADVVVANIMADVIIMLTPAVKNLLKNKESVFIASGIISERLDDVVAALEKNSFIVDKTREMNGWCVLTARRLDN